MYAANFSYKLYLYCGYGGINILGYNIAPVEQTDSHVLPLPGITLHHLIGGLKAGSEFDVNYLFPILRKKLPKPLNSISSIFQEIFFIALLDLHLLQY